MNNILNKKADICFENVNKEFTHNSTVVLTLKITYPQIKLEKNPRVQKRINNAYLRQANEFLKYASTKLYKSAIKEYKDAMKNGFPFRPYDAVMVYDVTLNDNCHLSTYYDQYQYTGGAHGMTYRVSDNWNLQTGEYIELNDLFEDKNYKKLIIDQIFILADKQMEQNPNIYFENYRELIVKTFNPDSFNLTPKTLSVHFQQYDIAPYASGIITFDILYKALCINPPHCG